LDAQLKSRWLEALESGRYEKGRGLLRTRDNGFCCLGVLVDIINPEQWGQTPNGGFFHGGFDHRFYPDERRLKEAGLSPDYAHVLAELNDRSATFEPVIQKLKEDSNETIAKWRFRQGDF
jgi:hypothetical protein